MSIRQQYNIFLDERVVRALRPDPADQARIFHLNAAKLLGLPS